MVAIPASTEQYARRRVERLFRFGVRQAGLFIGSAVFSHEALQRRGRLELETGIRRLVESLGIAGCGRAHT